MSACRSLHRNETLHRFDEAVCSLCKGLTYALPCYEDRVVVAAQAWMESGLRRLPNPFTGNLFVLRGGLPDFLSPPNQRALVLEYLGIYIMGRGKTERVRRDHESGGERGTR